MKRHTALSTSASSHKGGSSRPILKGVRIEILKKIKKEHEDTFLETALCSLALKC